MEKQENEIGKRGNDLILISAGHEGANEGEDGPEEHTSRHDGFPGVSIS